MSHLPGSDASVERPDSDTMDVTSSGNDGDALDAPGSDGSDLPSVDACGERIDDAGSCLPGLTIDPLQVDFGTISSQAVSSVSITSDGCANLIIFDILIEPRPTPFRVSSMESVPFLLRPHGRYSLTFVVSSTVGTGQVSGTATLVTNVAERFAPDCELGSFTIPLRAEIQ